MIGRLVLGIVVFCTFLSSSADAITMRYALIVGSNVGVDDDGTEPFPPLEHAEREAARLKEDLVGLSNFDASQRRTRLLTRASVDEVRAAFKAIARQKAADERLFKSMESIFLFYFTGHGLEGRLLLKDGTLHSNELIKWFNSVNADFSVGVFDACYAGSLENDLVGKGIRATRGVNMLRTLPSEVLSAKGSIWYVSSGPRGISYEDKALGGVFTHFFIDALKNAPKDGPGITLEKIWQYVRENTIKYTADRHRVQVPEQIIARLRSSTPVYFSFPEPRSATLVLTDGFKGRFALAYADGQLTEVFEKNARGLREFAVYPGRARLIFLDENTTSVAELDFTLASGGTLVLQSVPEQHVNPALGERAADLFPKGLRMNRAVNAVKLEPGMTLTTGVGYTFSYARKEMLHPSHRMSIPCRIDWNKFMLDVSADLGIDSRQYASWSYRSLLVGGTLRGGYGVDVGAIRLFMHLGISFGHIMQQFGDNSRRTGWQFFPSGGVGMILPRNGKILAEIFATLGPLYSPGSGFQSTSSWHVAGGVGVALYFRLM